LGLDQGMRLGALADELKEAVAVTVRPLVVVVEPSPRRTSSRKRRRCRPASLKEEAAPDLEPGANVTGAAENDDDVGIDVAS
jgi:hypothetical protein